MKAYQKATINPPVFFPAAALVLLLVALAAFAPDFAQQLFGSIQDWILGHVSWFYILTVAIILISIVYLALSKYGDIKLGPDHSIPDFKDYRTSTTLSGLASINLAGCYCPLSWVFSASFLR